MLECFRAALKNHSSGLRVAVSQDSIYIAADSFRVFNSTFGPRTASLADRTKHSFLLERADFLHRFFAGNLWDTSHQQVRENFFLLSVH